MDWQTLKPLISNDSDYPERANNLSALTAVVEGKQYAGLLYDFWTEDSGANKYIEMDKRRPSVRTNLCAVTVKESASLLFSQGRFPRIVVAADAEESDRMQALVEAAELRCAMDEAVVIGSVGSVAILVKFLSDRVFLEPMKTAFLTPTFDPNEPDKLLRVVERYKAKGKHLTGMKGAETRKPYQNYWCQRSWNTAAETIYFPQTIKDASEGKPPQVLSELAHNLDFVPIVWIKNLPGGEGCDGACTFEPGIDSVIELDYMESQADRAMRYMGDPKLIIKGKLSSAEDLTASAANAIVVPADGGDAKLLELQGGSSEAFDRRSKALRLHALEAMHGNLADPDKVSAATSGRAMELLHQRQIWQADRLRVSYGKGLMRIIRMIGEAASVYTVTVNDERLEPFTDRGLSLAWGAWFDPTYGDVVSFMSGLTGGTQGGVISEETATKVAAPVFGIIDVDAERKQIATERAEADKRIAATQAQTTAQMPVSN
jgi:hypothetical protein